MTSKFTPVRPFYWSHGVERVSNGRYTIEVYFENTGRGTLVHRVSIERPDGTNVNGGLYGTDWPRYDYPERVPAYVKAEARRLLLATR